jgi:hypothetical protein
MLFIGYAEYGGHWDIRDLGIVVAAGELPEAGGRIPDATFEPRVSICSNVPPLVAR